MGNRIIKESICVSEQIDELTAMEEVMFYRLLVNCDDYGCMDGRAKIVKAKLFPLKDISVDDIAEMLKGLEEVGLIRTYTVDGHPYLQVTKWAEHQRVRNSIHKYPAPDCGELPQLAANCGEMQKDAEKSGSRVRPRAGAESRIQNPYPESGILIQNPTRADAQEDDDDLHQIQDDHDRVLNAAEDAGFKMTNNVRSDLIALYAEHGLQKVLDGLNSCSEHGASNLAYLKACLRGGKKEKGGNPFLAYADRLGVAGNE